MKLIKNNNLKNGQVAIIVMLVSAVLMTVGLSMSRKSTTETKIDTNEELLKEAFNAAESGIDYYLGTGNANYSAPDSQSSALVTTENIGGGRTLSFGEYIPVNGTEYYWLVNHENDGSLGINYYTGTEVQVCGIGFTGSMEVNYFYKTGTDYGVKRYGYNFSSVNSASTRVNGFDNIAGNCTSSIAVGPSPILITVTSIFNGGKFYLNNPLSDGKIFPSQGENISSTGKTGNLSTDLSGAQVNKRLRVSRRYKIPPFMLIGVVSETSVLSD